MSISNFFSNEKNVERIYLAAFLALFLYCGFAVFSENSLTHQYPWKYGAYDAFAYYTHSESLKDSGSVLVFQPYMAGGFENSTFFQPPLRPIADAFVSYFTGVQSHDAIYINLFFIAALIALIFYIIIKQYNFYVALLSLPLSFFIFKFPFNTLFNWGLWSVFTGLIYFFALFWALGKYETKRMPVLITILLSAFAIAYFRMMHLFLLFLALFLGYNIFIAKKYKFKDEAIKWGGILLATIIASAYYIILLFSTYAFSTGNALGIETLSSAPTLVPRFTAFGLFLALIAAGIILSVTVKRKTYPLVMSLFFFFLAISNYFLFGGSIFKFRNFMPVYLGFFVGLLLYIGIAKLIKNQNARMPAYVILSFALMAYLAIANSFVLPGQLLSEPLHNDAYSWAHNNNNTPADSKFLFFYGDYYFADQFTFAPMQRVSYLVDANDLIAAYTANEIRRQYITRISVDGTGNQVTRTGLFSYSPINVSGAFDKRSREICNFNYFVLDKVGSSKELAGYNIQIINALLQKNNTIAFQNNYLVIVENKNLGGECINETKA